MLIKTHVIIFLNIAFETTWIYILTFLTTRTLIFNIGKTNSAIVYSGLHFGDAVFGLKLILKARTIMSALFKLLKHKAKNLF